MFVMGLHSHSSASVQNVRKSTYCGFSHDAKVYIKNQCILRAPNPADCVDSHKKYYVMAIHIYT